MAVNYNIIDILKVGDVLFEESKDSISEYKIELRGFETIIYFWRGSFYTKYNLNNSEEYNLLLERTNKFVRIEKKIDSEYYPIWTKVDGEISHNEKFVKLKNRYYTINFLENLIDQIIAIKKIDV